ncbi:MAG: hypothetical protein K2X93_12105 [Candidatus Obscuribacterales bacterium]|nr:hypothetical protein [Candidatus Obscuribacterales bacterium]
MEPDKAPNLEDLETIRLKLIAQIDEAQQIFDTHNNGHELLTSQAALKGIEQLLRRTRKQQKMRDS